MRQTATPRTPGFQPRADQWQQFRARYGPWAVVTGASSGIGRIVATFVLAAGLALAALMAMNDRNALAFREGVAEGYRAGHPAVESVSASVARPSGQESARR